MRKEHSSRMAEGVFPWVRNMPLRAFESSRERFDHSTFATCKISVHSPRRHPSSCRCHSTSFPVSYRPSCLALALARLHDRSCHPAVSDGYSNLWDCEADRRADPVSTVSSSARLAGPLRYRMVTGERIRFRLKNSDTRSRTRKNGLIQSKTAWSDNLISEVKRQ